MIIILTKTGLTRVPSGDESGNAICESKVIYVLIL